MDDLNNKIEENLPEDEYIRSVAIRSRNIEEVSTLLVMITAQIAEMKEIKNGPLYRRKVVLRSYETMLKERFRYLRVSKNRKNKDREIVKLKQDKLNEVIADKLIKTTLKQQRIQTAQKALADIIDARETIYQSFQNTEKSKASIDFEEKVKIFISRGYTPDEALNKAIRGDLVTENNLDTKLVPKPENENENEDKEQDQELNSIDINSLPSFNVLNENEPLTKQKPLIATLEQLKQARIENELEDKQGE